MLNLRRSNDVENNPSGLNNEFEYKNKKYHINLMFDTVLSFYKLLDDDHFNDEEKVGIAFELFFGNAPNNDDFAIEAFKQISNYLSADPYESEQTGDNNGIASPKYYSFEQDAEAIFASFYQQYRIDLINEKGKLHWDKFKALFAGLGPDTYFMRIVHIRQEDATKLEGQAQVELIQAQQHYALEDDRSQEAVQAQMADFGNMLMAIAKS